jgi:polyisoprenoid-binding protein YceI
VPALAAALCAPAPAGATSYTVDHAHTGVTFQVRHLFTYVDGRFKAFDGSIEFDLAHPENTKIKGTVDVASIDTNNAKRDDHLRSADFFHVAEHPTITFESTKVSDVDAAAKTAKVHGNLTIRGVTKAVVLQASFLGAATDPWGNKKAGFAAETRIDRKDFGLNWNQALETGGVLVGDEVKIRINVEANVTE